MATNPLFDPNNSQALLALGAGLLGTGATSGERISRGLLGFNQAYQSGVQQRMAQQEADLQRRVIEEKLAEQQREVDARKQVASLIGSRGGEYVMPEEQMFPGEAPIQGLGVAPSGLLGGEVSPQEFYTSLLGLPGYEGIGAGALEAAQRAQYQQTAAERPYYTPVQTSQGYFIFNNRTGEYTPMGAGGAVSTSAVPQAGAMAAPPQGMGAPSAALPIAADPELQARIAEAKAAASARGKTAGEAQAELPQAVASAEQTIGLIDAALAHPGRQTATGLSGSIDPRNYIPGTEARDFNILMDQLQGKAFLQAFESLKGGGQITEMEGRKATEAMARLNRAQSDEEFTKSLQELRSIAQAGIDRARQKAGQQSPVAQDDEYEALKARLLR